MPEQEFRQIVHNLLVNACDASEDGGVVELELAVSCFVENQLRLQLHVRDWGKGIAADHLPAIFEPFFTTKHDCGRSGMGLGLAISMSLATALQGTIQVTTNTPCGSVFTLDLPVSTTDFRQNN
jgi:signal transduction histidine kinase